MPTVCSRAVDCVDTFICSHSDIIKTVCVCVCQSEIVCVGRQEAEQQRLQRHSERSCRAGKTVSLLKP